MTGMPRRRRPLTRATGPGPREVPPTPAIERLRDRLTEPDDPPGLREIAAAVVELADMLRARRPAP